MSIEESALERLSAVLDELADADAAALVAEARIEARSRVRSLLAEALAERLLANAERELASVRSPSRAPGRVRDDPPARAPRATASTSRAKRSDAAPRAKRPDAPSRGKGRVRRERPAPDPSQQAAPAHHEQRGEERLGWYVYGIVAQDFEVPALRGVDERHPLEVVSAAGLGALASKVSLEEFGEQRLQEHMEDLAWLEGQARRHEEILEAVREQRATVVPMRLFTIYESGESLGATLERERSFLGEALERLADRTEWGVKLFSMRTSPAPDDDDTGETGPGESYMRRRRAADGLREELGMRLQALRDAAHRRLAEASVEGRVNPLQPPELSEHEGAMLLNGVYLVENDTVEEFVAEVSALRDEYAAEEVDVVLTGPWPPYNFVNSSQEAGV